MHRVWVSVCVMSGCALVLRAVSLVEGDSGVGRGWSSIGRLGSLGCIRYRTSTCDLSTWWSSTALGETWF